MNHTQTFHLKHLLFVAFFCLLITFQACKKSDSSTPDATPMGTAQFSTDKNNYYIGEDVTLIPATFKAGSDDTYSWDFGDGETESSFPINKYHSYDKGGIYTITLKANGKQFSKKIRIYPGTMSYQVSNTTSFNFVSTQIAIIDGYDHLNQVTLNINKNATTDTLYATDPGNAAVGKVLFCAGHIGSNNFQVNDVMYAFPHKHTIFTLTDMTHVNGKAPTFGGY